MAYKRLRHRASILALTGTLVCTNTITALAVEVSPGSDYANSIAIIVSEEGKEDRTNRDFRIPELPVELLKEGQVVSKDTSDEMGVAIFDNVEPGEYEIKLPESYKGLTLVKESSEGKVVIDKGKQEAIKVSYNGNVSRQARAPEDGYRGKLDIKVVDDKGNPIPGAGIIVQGVSSKDYQHNFVADKKGEISVGNMKPGEYILKQTPSLAKNRGYKIKQSVYNVKVTESSNPVTIENKLDGDFVKAAEIPKVKGEDRKPQVKVRENKEERKPGDVIIQVLNPEKKKEITNLEVPVYKKGTDKPVKILKTDKYGAIEVNGLEPGIYEYQVPGTEKKVQFNVANYDALFTLGEKAKEKKKAEVTKSRTMIGLVSAGAVTLLSLTVVLLRKFKRSKRRD